MHETSSALSCASSLPTRLATYHVKRTPSVKSAWKPRSLPATTTTTACEALPRHHILIEYARSEGARACDPKSNTDQLLLHRKHQ
mmetsp:Transcript_17589/g.38175  ORF Transcript_17589/g.38175 Transcript_17589/m.38175 type:complete len:85 (-) Transcript_17589:46-300(-)